MHTPSSSVRLKLALHVAGQHVCKIAQEGGVVRSERPWGPVHDTPVEGAQQHLSATAIVHAGRQGVRPVAHRQRHITHRRQGLGLSAEGLHSDTWRANSGQY